MTLRLKLGMCPYVYVRVSLGVWFYVHFYVCIFGKVVRATAVSVLCPPTPPTSWKSLDVTYFEGIQSYIPCSCNSHICFCVTLHIVFYVVVSIGRKLDRYCHQSYAYILVNFKALPADLVYIVMFYLHIIFCNVTLIMTFPQQHICFNLTHYPFKTLFFIISVIQFFNCQELI